MQPQDGVELLSGLTVWMGGTSTTYGGKAVSVDRLWAQLTQNVAMSPSAVPLVPIEAVVGKLSV